MEKNKPKFTIWQQKAIDIRDCNVLVSASAGAGKTAVLTERIVNLLLDKNKPIDIDRIVVVTFTRAAAAEMRGRIAGKLTERLNEDPGNAHIEKQLALISHAQISTIDSFCLGILRNYFYTIGIDPSFRIGDKEEMDLLMNEVLAEVLEDEYKRGDSAFIDMMETLAPGKSDAPVESLITGLYNMSQSHPWPSEWLDACKTMYDIDSAEQITSSEWFVISGIWEHVRSTLIDSINKLNRAIDIVEHDGLQKISEFLEDERNDLEYILGGGEFFEVGRRMSEYQYNAFPRTRLADELKPFKDRAKELRDDAKKVVTAVCEDCFGRSPEEIVRDIKGCAPGVKELIRVTLEFADRLAARKEQENVFDFSDIEHFVLKILLEKNDGEGYKKTHAARELTEQYEYILIDEYQDSNDVQEAILSAISKESIGQQNMFMVGDVKQSIYGFRLAKPDIFEGKMSRFDDVEGQEESEGTRVLLKKNFRSSKTILRTVNYIFSNIMHRQIGNVEYDETHYFDIDEEKEEACEEPVELMYITSESGESEYNKRQLEVMAIAERIRQLTDTDKGMKIEDKGCLRTVRYSDIVILLRSMSGWSEEFVQVLTTLGIPAIAEEQTGYFSAREIQVALSMLRIIDNPHQDIPLAAVLRSVYGGFEDEELALIKAGTDGDMYDALCAVSTDSGLYNKVNEFLEMLSYYRKQSAYITVYELLMELYGEKDYLNRMKAMPAGDRREGNLMMLADRALSFENGESKGLAAFLRYIEDMKKADIDFGEAKVSGDGNGAIRIMSIHKSKGLEFPVVFVAAMGKQINLQDAKKNVIVHAEIGPALDYFDREKRIKRKSLIKRATVRKIINDSVGEELRVIYVAFTRPKSKLIITGFVDDAEQYFEKKASKTNSYSDMLGGKITYYDWLTPCLMKHPSWGKDEAVDGVKVTVIDANSLLLDEGSRIVSRQERLERLLQAADSPIIDKSTLEVVEAERNYLYPYAGQSSYAMKVSVSDIKHKAAIMEDEESVRAAWADTEHPRYVPSFMREDEPQKLSGADRGTLYHSLMEHLDIESIITVNDVDIQMKELALRGVIPEMVCHSNIISRKKILEFVKSPVASRMVQADKKGLLLKEQPFVMGVPASRVYPDDVSDEIILVQGIIDVFFEEEDEIVLLDYKTDRINEGEEGKLAGRYKAQMECYREAIEKAKGKPVKEIILYSFALGKEIKVDIDE